MSSWGRVARAARRRLPRRRPTGPRLVGLTSPEGWTTAAHLSALEAALRAASPDAVLRVSEPRAAEPPSASTDLLLVLDPDAALESDALAAALDQARTSGQVVVGTEGGSLLGRLDPRDVIAPASAWAARGAVPTTATAADVLDVLGTDPVVVAPWWVPGRGDGGLPLARQRRFRADLVAARAEGLLEALAALRRTRPAEVDPWRVWLLSHPLPGWYADAVGGGPAYLEALRPLVTAMVDGLPPEHLARVPVSARRAAHAAAHSGLEELALLLDHDGDHADGLPVEDGLVAMPPGVALPPDPWRRLEQVDRAGHARLVHAWRDERGRAHLRGVAWTDYTPDSSPPRVEVRTGDRWTAVSAEGWHDDQVALAVGRALEDHPLAGFRVAVADLDGAVRVRQGDHLHVLEPTWLPVAPAGAPRVVGASVVDAALRLELDRPARASHPALVDPRTRAHAGSADGTTLSLPLTATLFGEDARLPAGRYRVDGLELGVDPVLLADPPELDDGPLRASLEVGPAGRLLVRVATALTAAERSARGQQRLRETAASRPLRPATVLLETFHGRSAGDNPGPVAEALRSLEPGLDLAMVVDDPRVTPPAGVRAVVRRSGEWHDLMQTAAAYVANAAAPSWWTKPPGQVHLQTWHGTPLKRIGEDRGPGDLAVWRHRRDVASQAAGWDGLVSANPLSSRAFRSAFGYTGELLELGYPRNDLLVDPARRDRTREQVRAALGLSPEQQVVLYAPTWREYAGVRDAKPLLLDAPTVVAALPETVVLVRGHYNAGRAADAFPGEARVIDVTRYPDVAPLFCAADVLVTDYSSVMFDFALLDRPIVLLAPDLEQYRDVERGFYTDLETHAPGDLVRTTEEVVDRLRSPDTGARARAAFREEFCPWEDGDAAGRVARWLLSRLG